MRFTLDPVALDGAGGLPGWSFRIPLPIAPQSAFDLLCDVVAWPKWYPDIVSMTWMTPPGQGARRAVVTKTAALEERFVAWEPGKRMGFYVETMSIPLVTAFTEDFQVDAADGGSLLRWDIRYRARWMFRPIRPVLDPVFRGMFDRGIAKLPAFAAEWERAR